MIPKKGEQFMFKNPMDGSYDGAILECTYVDDDRIVAKIVKNAQRNRQGGLSNGWVVDVQLSNYVCVPINEKYRDARMGIKVPGNGFGFVRQSKMPKLVLSGNVLAYA